MSPRLRRLVLPAFLLVVLGSIASSTDLADATMSDQQRELTSLPCFLGVLSRGERPAVAELQACRPTWGLAFRQGVVFRSGFWDTAGQRATLHRPPTAHRAQDIATSAPVIQRLGAVLSVTQVERMLDHPNPFVRITQGSALMLIDAKIEARDGLFRIDPFDRPKLRDSLGYEYQVELFQARTPELPRQVAAGRTARGWLTFMVPATAGGFTLIVHGVATPALESPVPELTGAPQQSAMPAATPPSEISSAPLLALDSLLLVTYTDAMAQEETDAGRAELRAEQVAWLHSRDQTCSTTTFADGLSSVDDPGAQACLRSQIRNRITALRWRFGA